MNPLFHTEFSISDSLKNVRKSVLIYETIIEQEILNLDDIDIFQSCEFERYWKNAEVSAYLCQMACAEEECEKELQKIAEHFKIPACFLEAIPMKKGSGDDEIYNNGEKENEESTT